MPAGNPEGLTYDAVVAVPIDPLNEPVKDDAIILYPDASIAPLTNNEPVIFAPPDWAIIPRLATNSFAIGRLQMVLNI